MPGVASVAGVAGVAGAIGTPPRVGVTTSPNSPAIVRNCSLSGLAGAKTAKARSSAACALSRLPITTCERTRRSQPAMLSGLSASFASSPSTIEAIIACRSSGLRF